MTVLYSWPYKINIEWSEMELRAKARARAMYKDDDAISGKHPGRPWQIMLKFLPIFLFLYSPIFHLLFFLFYLFCFSINPFFSNIVVAT